MALHERILATGQGLVGTAAVLHIPQSWTRDLNLCPTGLQDQSETLFSARTRHVSALANASSHLAKASENLRAAQPGELIAEDLKLAQKCLGEITGKISSDELLGKIFSSFCIGK